MLYHLIYPLYTYVSGLNLFRYITFRSAVAVMVTLAVFFLIGKPFIEWIRRKTRSPLRKLTPENHRQKTGTPSMGGLLIVSTVVFSVGIAGNFTNPNVILCLIALVGFSILGFIDDYIKETKEDGKGIASRVKLSGQLLLSFTIAVYLYYLPHNKYFIAGNFASPLSPSAITFPFLSETSLELGWFYIPFAMFIIVGASNAVNITDGLDGLATVLAFLVFLSFTVITYLSGHQGIAEYLKIPFSPQVGELTVFLAALCGACMGFLWYNCHPAQIFMGDTGALSLGGIMGVVALLLKKEILLAVIGGVFVVETFSVIIQVFSYKWRRRRVFKMAPIHHHFEIKGLPESKVIIRFWIIGAILALIGVVSFKIR